MELLVLEHHPDTGVCRFADVLDGRRGLVAIRHLDVTADASTLPDDVDGLAGVLTMGGPQSATGLDEHAWMRAEADLLRRAVAAGVPVLGVCLGAQLLGAALGGEVARRATPQVGYLEVDRTDLAHGDDLAAGWPDGTAVLFHHEDDVATLPPDAEALLTAGDGVALWRVGSAYAVQAHPEVDADQLARWVATGQLRGLVERAGVDPDDLLEEARRRERFVVAAGTALLGRWVDGPVRRRVTGSSR